MFCAAGVVSCYMLSCRSAPLAKLRQQSLNLYKQCFHVSAKGAVGLVSCYMPSSRQALLVNLRSDHIFSLCKRSFRHVLKFVTDFELSNIAISRPDFDENKPHRLKSTAGSIGLFKAI